MAREFSMEATVETVPRKVQEAIRDDGRFATAFEPFAEGLHHEGEFWFVPVRLRRFEPADERMRLYAQFAKLESYLQKDKHLKVVLLPVVPAMAN